MVKAANLFLTIVVTLFSCTGLEKPPQNKVIIHELNEREIAKGVKTIALVGAKLIDGNGGEPLGNSTVIIREGRIESVGRSGETVVPKNAATLDGTGPILMPCVIAPHYTNEESLDIAAVSIAHGVTA